MNGHLLISACNSWLETLIRAFQLSEDISYKVYMFYSEQDMEGILSVTKCLELVSPVSCCVVSHKVDQSRTNQSYLVIEDQ